MQIRDPRITVQNTDGEQWLVTADGLLSGVEGLESVGFTVLVPRSNASVTELTSEAIRRAVFLLNQHLEISQEL